MKGWAAQRRGRTLGSPYCQPRLFEVTHNPVMGKPLCVHAQESMHVWKLDGERQRWLVDKVLNENGKLIKLKKWIWERLKLSFFNFYKLQKCTYCVVRPHEWDGDSVRDRLLSSGTVSALCTACFTLVSPVTSHTDTQQEHWKAETVSSKMVSDYFQLTLRSVVELANMFFSAKQSDTGGNGSLQLALDL